MIDRLENLPNSCRPLQMVHGLDQWPDTTDAGLRARLQALLNAGLGGIVTNVSFKNYLRDEKAWALLVRGVKIAHELGMRVWIYDEEGYPSGAAGGLVLEKRPQGEAQGLIRTVDASGRPAYEVIRLYEATHATENFYKKRPYINILDRPTVQTFIEVTHEQYARHLQPIGEYVEAFFTDEPSLIPAYIPKDKDYPLTLPWHPTLEEEFHKRKGYDLRPHLESLFVKTGEIDRKIRCDFYEVLTDLCAETYFGQLQSWCQQHHVASSGHLLGEEKLVWQTDFDGEPFANYRRFDIPGIDMITSDPEKILGNIYFIVPRIAGSAARLQGKKRVMCEISDFFGIMDKHHASMEQMQCTTGMLYSAGVTDLCSYYAINFAPEPKEYEFPPAEYARFTQYATRLNAIFTSGEIETHVALLHPAVAYWSHFTPPGRSMYEPHPDKEVEWLDTAFTDVCRSLLQQQIDYDVVDERSLAGATVEGKMLAIGPRKYQVLLLPPMDCIRLATMEAIERFARQGGSVIAHPMLPRYAAEGPEHDREIVAMVERVRKAGGVGGSAAGSSPIGYLIKSRIPPDCALAPASPHVLCTSVVRKDGTAYFFVNSSSKEYAGTCTVKPTAGAALYDPSTGEERPIQVEKVTDLFSRISLTLPPFGSLFVLPK